jgi:hypothetical protein
MTQLADIGEISFRSDTLPAWTRRVRTAARAQFGIPRGPTTFKRFA